MYYLRSATWLHEFISSWQKMICCAVRNVFFSNRSLLSSWYKLSNGMTILSFQKIFFEKMISQQTIFLANMFTGTFQCFPHCVGISPSNPGFKLVAWIKFVSKIINTRYICYYYPRRKTVTDAKLLVKFGHYFKQLMFKVFFETIFLLLCHNFI